MNTSIEILPEDNVPFEVKEGSKRFSLSSGDLKKITTGLGVAMVGAAVTYLTSVSGMIDYTIDGTDVSLIAAGIWSVLFNLLRKFIADNTEQFEFVAYVDDSEYDELLQKEADDSE